MQLDEHLVVAKLGEQVDLEVGDQGQLLVGRGGHLLEGLLSHSVLRAVTLQRSSVTRLSSGAWYELRHFCTLREKELAGYWGTRAHGHTGDGWGGRGGPGSHAG